MYHTKHCTYRYNTLYQLLKPCIKNDFALTTSHNSTRISTLIDVFFASKIKIISFNILISPTLLQAGLYKLIILSIYQRLRVKQFFFISSKVHVLKNMKSNYHVDDYTGGSDFHATFCIPLVNIYAQMLLHSISHGTTLYQITWCHSTQNNIQVNKIFTIITFDFLKSKWGFKRIYLILHFAIGIFRRSKCSSRIEREENEISKYRRHWRHIQVR